jgi:uncharacterized OB-fold protein
MTFTEWLWERIWAALDWLSSTRKGWWKRLTSSRCARCGRPSYPTCDACNNRSAK